MNVFDTLPTIRLVTPSRRGRAVPTLCSLLLLAASAAPAVAQPEPGPELSARSSLTDPADVPRAGIPALKAAYLECDRSASERLLDFGEAMLCSHVAEALLTRAFERDFNRLLGWWKAEKAARASALATVRQPASTRSAP